MKNQSYNSPHHSQSSSTKNSRPLWTVLVLLTKDEKFNRECIESVFSQNLPENEIQVAIIGREPPSAAVQDILFSYGNSKISYHHINTKVKGTSLLNSGLTIANGRFIHIINGTDRVKKGFYLALDKLLWHFPGAGVAACCSSIVNSEGVVVQEELPEMDRKGIIPDWLNHIAQRNLLPLGSVVVKREVFELIGDFYGDTYGAVWEMWARIAKNYPVAYTPQILFEWRENLDSAYFSTSANDTHEDIIHAMGLIQHYLPDEDKSMILRRSKKFYAKKGLIDPARLSNKVSNKAKVEAEIRKALSLQGKGRDFYWNLAKMYIKMKLKIL